MNWLDGVMAVPTIGIRIKANFKDISDFRQRLEYFIEQLREEHGNILIKPSQVWGYTLEVEEGGFQFDLSHKNLVISYTYPITQIPQAGKLPTLVLPKIRTFSELFEKILAYGKDILDNLEKLNNFYFDRIGIIAGADLEKDSLPPGLEKWIGFLGRPWGSKITRTDSIMSVMLNKEQSYYENCHHSLKFDQANLDKNGFELKLDWQRVFNQPLPLKSKELIKQLTNCKEIAFEYFQRFGEGDLNYD